MSAPIQQKLGAALKVLSRARPAVDLKLQPDKNLSNLENALLLEAQLEKVQKEGRTLEIFLDDIRESSSAWTDLLRKLAAAERDAGEAAFEAFDRKEKINDKVDDAAVKLRDLRDLAGTLTVQAKLYRSRANKDERDAQAVHDKAVQQNTAAPRSNAPPFAAPLYQFQPIQLEKFGGHKRRWPEFYESYKSAIGSQPISKAEKFNFLRNMLTGEARDLVAGFRLEDSNYDVALQLLKDTYGAPEEHIRALHFELANLKACRTLRDTKEFLLQLERLTRELNNAGEDIEGPPTFLMLEKKLTPGFLRTILTKKAEDPAHWNTNKFRDTLSISVRKETQIQEVMGEYGHPSQFGKTTQPSTQAHQQRARLQPAPAFRSRYRSPPPRERTFISSAVDEANKRFGTKLTQRKPQQTGQQAGLQPYPQKHWPTATTQRKPQHTGQRADQQPPQHQNGQAARPFQSANPQGSGGFKRSEPPSPCIFCGSGHWNEECRKFSTLQQRTAVIREKRLCFKCLKSTHRSFDCPKPKRCFRCGQPHPAALCPNGNSGSMQIAAATIGPNEDENGSPSTAGIGTESEPQQSTVVRDNEKKALLMTTTSTVFNPAQPQLSMAAAIFLDPGSHRSFISNRAAQQLDLPVVHREECHLTSFGERKPKKYVSDRVKIGILGTAGEKLIFNLNALGFMVSEMPIIELSGLDTSQLQQRKLALPHETTQPDILLGINIWHELNVQPIERLPSGFTLCQSKIGKILSGSGRIALGGPSVNVTFVLPVQNEAEEEPDQAAKTEPISDDNEIFTTEDDLKRDDQLNRFFGLHIIGMDDTSTKMDQDAVMIDFKKTLSFVENRYQVALPWTERVNNLPTNYLQAKMRLISLVRKLRTLNLVAEYQTILTDQLQKSVIERVDMSSPNIGPVHYLPHRAVIRTDKATTKIRIVMDASAKPKNNPAAPSLNDCLHTGPLLLKDLTGVLIRFRRMKRVLMADIEKAFLQLGVRQQDRDATRFLWLANPATDKLDPLRREDVLVYRFCRVSFGLTVSPFLLNATIREHLAMYDSDLARRIDENLYVDNILIEVKNEEELPALVCEAKAIFATAGMVLREFFGSDLEEVKKLPPADLANELEEAKVLGISWRPKHNRLLFKMPTFDGKITKRTILAHIAKVFDPLGLMAPALLPAKVFLQSVQNFNPKWDDELPEHFNDAWRKIVALWTIRGEPFVIEFPRFITSTECDQFHCFCDASRYGMGIAVYQKAKTDNGNEECNLIYGKSLVKPLKLGEHDSTIPKLELQALTLGVKAVKFIQGQLHFKDDQVLLWTDSQCSIERLKENRKQDRFVSNRLKKIREANFQVRHVRTDSNPADLASRGTDPQLLVSSLLWRFGPIWLAKSGQWPEPNATYNPGEEIKEVVEPPIIDLSMAIHEAQAKALRPSIQVKRFSNWNRLKATAAYALRFIMTLILATKFEARNYPLYRLSRDDAVKNLRKKPTTGPLTPNELERAEEWLLKEMQLAYLPTRTLIRDLRLFHGNGVWRCGGRIGQADQLDYEIKFPVYLPPESWLTKLIVRNYDNALHHCGPKTLLSKIREKYWIPRGRKTVKHILYSPDYGCLECRRDRLRPYAYPRAPHLPKERVNEARPFSQTGVDYFGPLKVRRGTDTVKIYVALFTCLVIRAIHLEVAEDYSAEAFLRAFRRFVARRGTPTLIRSDQGTNFVAGAKVIKEKWTDTLLPARVQQQLAHQGVNWFFNTAKAPWKGGSWERLVGITKNALRRSVGRNLLTMDEFSTLISEIEAIVNQRPLTFESDEEPGSILRPVHFLIPYGQAETNFPLIAEDHNDPDYNPSNRDKLHAMLRHADSRLDKFWHVWKSDYLLSLRERDRGTAEIDQQHPTEGDVVIVQDDHQPRSLWTLARVLQVQKGGDGAARTALIKINGKEKSRSINQLFNLEIGTSFPVEQVNSIMDRDPDSISLAGSDEERDMDQSGPSKSGYKIPRKTDIVFKKQRHFLGRNLGLNEVQQKPSDYDPAMGLLYAPRPKGKKLFFKNGSLKRLLELTTVFSRGKGVQIAKELLDQHGKIPMKDWAAKEQQITAELLEQEEKRQEKSKERKQQIPEQSETEQQMFQRLFGDSPGQIPEQTTDNEAKDKESRLQQNEKRIKWHHHRKAAVDELRRKMKLRKRQQAPASIEEDIDDPGKEDQQHLQKLIKDGSQEAQRAFEASNQLTLRQQSQQPLHHKPQRHASDLPTNGEKLIDFCKRLYGDHLESAWKRQRAFKEMQEILESGNFKLYHVNGQQASIKCFLANRHGLGGLFIINKIESFNHPDEFEFRTAPAASKGAIERPESPEILIITAPEQNAPRPTTRFAGRTPPPGHTPPPFQEWLKERNQEQRRPPIQNKPLRIEEYQLAAHKEETFVPVDIFLECGPDHTACAKSAIYSEIAGQRKVVEGYEACTAISLFHAMILHWLHRYQPNPYEAWQLHEDYAVLDGSIQREAAEHFWRHQVVNQKRPLFKPATLIATIGHWRQSCDHFAELFQTPSMAPIRFQPINRTQTANPFQNWLEEINTHASDKTSQMKAKLHFPQSRYLNNAETIVIGETIAEAFSHGMPQAFWFSHTVTDPLRVFFGPKIRRLVFAYDADIKNIVKYLAPIIHPLSKTDVEMNIILGKEDNLDWLENKKHVLSLAQLFKIGFFVFNGKPGEISAISERIQGQQVEDMEVDSTPSTSTAPSSSRSSKSGSRDIINTAMLIGLFCLLAIQPTGGQAIRQKRFGGVGIWPGNDFLNFLWSRERRTPALTTAGERYVEKVRAFYATSNPPITFADLTTQPSWTTTQAPITDPPTTQTVQKSQPTGTTTRPTTTTRKKWIQTTQTIPTTTRQKWIQTTQTIPTSTRRKWIQTTQTIPTTTRSPSWTTTRPMPSPTYHRARPTVQPAATPTKSYYALPLKREQPAESANPTPSDRRIINANGDNIFWCTDRGSSIWELKGTDSSPFCRPPPSLNAEWHPLQVDLYVRITKPEEIASAWHCAIKRTTETYYTNLFGDHFVDIEKEFAVNERTCALMARQQVCSAAKTEMLHQGDQVWTTSDTTEVEFSGAFAGLFKGRQSSSATNCFAQPAALYVKRHNLELVSPIHQVRNCIYSTATAVTDYEMAEGIDGDFTPSYGETAATWLSKDRQKALTFAANAPELLACDGAHIVLSEQNFGIPKKLYDDILSTQHAKKKRHVQPEQLAAQLSASQIATNMALAQLYMRECQRNIRAANPTLQARKLLRRQNLQARWIGESTIEVFQCVDIKLTDISYRPTKTCMRYIPITVHLPESTMDAFLDPELRVISFGATAVSCTHFRFHYLQLHASPSTWLQIDTHTGVARRLESNVVHDLYETVLNHSNNDMDLHPLIFHRWQLDNETDSTRFPHISEFAELENFKDKLDQHSSARAEALGALTGGLEGWTKQWLKGILNSVVEWWIRMACAYSTFLLLRDIVIPCILTYLFDPIRITVLSLLGVRRPRQPPIENEMTRLPRFHMEEDILLHNPRRAPNPTTRREEGAKQPVHLDVSAKTAHFRQRTQSNTEWTGDTPFGRTRRLALDD
uniref:Integrase catalytic domain-containing protein n=1 Tax=Globodera rostochiensis TaxID=31243 RepID=A0A914IGD7_GLORO